MNCLVRRKEGRSIRSLYRDERGSALIEFVLAATLLYTLVFGIMDCSRALYVDHFLANAAREGTRYAMVRGVTWGVNCSSAQSFSCTASSANVTSFIRSLVSAGIAGANVAVTTTWPGKNVGGTSCDPTYTNAAGCLVLIKVTYPFTFVSPLLTKKVFTMTSTAETTISQ